MIHTPVLIVGGGPVGLALAGDLGWRNTACLLIEQSDGSIYQPKMDGVNVRTMEFCRRWGLVETIKNCPYPRNYPQDMVYLTSMNGYELGRETFLTPSGGAEERKLGASPETRVRCPQNMFDPILQGFAKSMPGVTLRYRQRLVGIEQFPDHVEAEIEDVETGKFYKVTTSYLVGCDGAASKVRESQGIEMLGPGALTYTTNVIFRCANLVSLHDKQLAYRHLFVGPEGTWATMVAINGRDEWRVSIIGNGEPRLLSDQEIKDAILRLVGRDFDFEIVSVVPWVRRELVAATYAKGRVFLAGDSAHVMSPTGGFGMNTGIADAVDLSWKLDATLRGWGGPQLLASYDLERRPIGARAAREASGNLLRTLAPGSNPALLDKTLEGALIRHEVGRKFSATLLREWYKLGLDLGYGYAGSPICVPEAESPDPVPLDENANLEPPNGQLSDATPITPSLLREWQRLSVHLAESYPVKPAWQELSPQSVMIYKQSAAPGGRAPHVEMKDGRSTLDLFGKGFVLLCCVPDGEAVQFKSEAALLASAAQSANLPLQVVFIDEAAIFNAYRRRMTLVRPDGHVAWRGDHLPDEGAQSLVDRVRGALPVETRARMLQASPSTVLA